MGYGGKAVGESWAAKIVRAFMSKANLLSDEVYVNTLDPRETWELELPKGRRGFTYAVVLTKTANTSYTPDFRAVFGAEKFARTHEIETEKTSVKLVTGTGIGPRRPGR